MPELGTVNLGADWANAQPPRNPVVAHDCWGSSISVAGIWILVPLLHASGLLLKNISRILFVMAIIPGQRKRLRGVYTLPLTHELADVRYRYRELLQCMVLTSCICTVLMYGLYLVSPKRPQQKDSMKEECDCPEYRLLLILASDTCRYCTSCVWFDSPPSS